MECWARTDRRSQHEPASYGGPARWPSSHAPLSPSYSAAERRTTWPQPHSQPKAYSWARPPGSIAATRQICLFNAVSTPVVTGSPSRALVKLVMAGWRRTGFWGSAWPLAAGVVIQGIMRLRPPVLLSPNGWFTQRVHELEAAGRETANRGFRLRAVAVRVRSERLRGNARLH